MILGHGSQHRIGECDHSILCYDTVTNTGNTDLQYIHLVLYTTIESNNYRSYYTIQSLYIHSCKQRNCIIEVWDLLVSNCRSGTIIDIIHIF